MTLFFRHRHYWYWDICHAAVYLLCYIFMFILLSHSNTKLHDLLAETLEIKLTTLLWVGLRKNDTVYKTKPKLTGSPESKRTDYKRTKSKRAFVVSSCAYSNWAALLNFNFIYGFDPSKTQEVIGEGKWGRKVLPRAWVEGTIPACAWCDLAKTLEKWIGNDICCV